MSERQFPVIWPISLERMLSEMVCPLSVPWGLVAAHEAQAKKNHNGQSLDDLAKRHGLDPIELLAVLTDRDFREVRDRMLAPQIVRELKRLVRTFEFGVEDERARIARLLEGVEVEMRTLMEAELRSEQREEAAGDEYYTNLAAGAAGAYEGAAEKIAAFRRGLLGEGE